MSSLRTPGEDRKVWTRDRILASLRRWAVVHGGSPRASDFNPSAARWAAQEWRIARYRAGDPDGGPWPSLNVIKGEFGGSFNAALREAGLEVNRPGPPRRESVDLGRAGSSLSPEDRVALDAARARIAVLERRLASAERPRPERVRTVTKTRTVSDPKLRERARRAEASAERARIAASEARSALSTALDAARAAEGTSRESERAMRAATRRADAADRRVASLREELRVARRDLRRVENALESARVREPVVERVEVFRERPSPGEREIEAARMEARKARGRARRAEEAAARAEAAYRELASAVTGEDRRLSVDELRSLRESGPSGPAVMSAALRDLAAARRSGNGGMDAALLRVASAAVTWRERLR